MSVHTKSREHSHWSMLLVLAAFVVAITVAVQAAGGTVGASTGPVIAKPTTVPAQPVAGRRFTVSFRVTQGVAGAPLTRGTMVCHPWVAAQVLPHAESFKGGLARLSFLVPTSAAEKVLKVKVTIKAASGSATRVSAFRVLGATTSSISISGVTSAEGGSRGSVTVAFPVKLSAPASQPVSVDYATADGTATAPADYAETSGTLTFARGQTVKTIPVAIVGDEIMEQAETFSVTLSNAVNATIANGTATATITNDDTAVPVTPGSYKGQTQNGNYVFFTVTAERIVTAFRINDIPCTCDGPLRLTGGENFGESRFLIRADGSFAATGSWTGSDVKGDVEWTHWDADLKGNFATATSASGTIVENYELNYKGRHYRCTTGQITWSAALQS